MSPRLITTVTPDFQMARTLMVGPPNLEACCFETPFMGQFLCADLVPSQCEAFQGVRAGEDTDCATFDCSVPIPGACCLEAGGCIETDSDSCKLPDLFFQGLTCIPDPCPQDDCWFVGSECCTGGPQSQPAVPCALALFIDELVGFTPWYYRVAAGTCYEADTVNNTVINEIDLQLHFEVIPVSPFHDNCPVCCAGFTEPCPPPIIGYCTNCQNPEILSLPLMFSVPNCGQGTLEDTVLELTCNPELQSWDGTHPADGGGGVFDGMQAPGGGKVDTQYLIDCDGRDAFPDHDPIPNTWVATVSASGQGNCPQSWTFRVAISGPRLDEDFPFQVSFDTIEYDDNINVESFAIELPWLAACNGV